MRLQLQLSLFPFLSSCECFHVFISNSWLYEPEGLVQMSLSVYILFVHGKVKYLAPFQIHIAFVFLLKMICLSPDPDVLDHACKAKNE